MGGSYGSIHFRTSDRVSVLNVAADVARETSHDMLCGPVLDGWVALYPSHKGQDDSLAAVAAAKFPGEVFYLCVHDDDIFIYRYYRGGQLVDSFWSAPGYFTEQDFEEQALESGHPERYAHLISGDVKEVRALLDGEDPTFEVERLDAFSRLLGISNAVTCFEYLEHGEVEDIRDWEEFVPVPDRRGAKNAARRERNAEHEQLTAEGLLLCAVESEPGRSQRPRSVTVDVRGRRTTIEPPSSPRHGVSHPHSSHRLVTEQFALVIWEGQEYRRLWVGDSNQATDYNVVSKLRFAWSKLSVMSREEVLDILLSFVPRWRRAEAQRHLLAAIPPPPREPSILFALAHLTQGLATRVGHPAGVTFSSDGEWLFCGTDHGLRVARWSDVLPAADGSAIPWKFAGHVLHDVSGPVALQGYVYAWAHDAADARCVFGGMDGRLRVMSLENGQIEHLFDVPGRAPILGMTWLDEQTLATFSQPGFPAVDKKPQNPWVHVWDYRQLCRRAGLR